MESAELIKMFVTLFVEYMTDKLVCHGSVRVTPWCPGSGQGHTDGWPQHQHIVK